MWKKIGLITFIVFLLVGSLAMIGWIGFQEKIRLAVKNLHEEGKEKPSIEETLSDPKREDHSVVETKAEATEVVERLEELVNTLGEDDLPSE